MKKFKKKPEVYDFHGGEKTTKSERKKWIDEILEELQYDKFFHISTGNSIVIGMRSKEEITIIEVDKGYKQYTYGVKR